MHPKDITNQRFDRLVAIKATNQRASRQVIWLCHCDCGNLTKVRSGDLRSGGTRSCGCLKQEPYNLTHGHARDKSPTYLTWKSMLQRCYNENHTYFRYYGGCGIEVFTPWHDFQTFLTHLLATIGLRPPGRSIDRIDPYGNYEPGNIKWSTPKEQANNRR